MKVSTDLYASIYEKRNRQGEIAVRMVLLKSNWRRRGCLPQLFVISTAQTMPRPQASRDHNSRLTRNPNLQITPCCNFETASTTLLIPRRAHTAVLQLVKHLPREKQKEIISDDQEVCQMAAIRAVRHETSPDNQLHPQAALNPSIFRFHQNIKSILIVV
jgi:hypothetical protein